MNNIRYRRKLYTYIQSRELFIDGILIKYDKKKKKNERKERKKEKKIEKENGEKKTK